MFIIIISYRNIGSLCPLPSLMLVIMSISELDNSTVSYSRCVHFLVTVKQPTTFELALELLMGVVKQVGLNASQGTIASIREGMITFGQLGGCSLTAVQVSRILRFKFGIAENIMLHSLLTQPLQICAEKLCTTYHIGDKQREELTQFWNDKVQESSLNQFSNDSRYSFQQKEMKSSLSLHYVDKVNAQIDDAETPSLSAGWMLSRYDVGHISGPVGGISTLSHNENLLNSRICIQHMQRQSHLSHFRRDTQSETILHPVWTCNLGKCIDASPTLYVSYDLTQMLVFMGSHSHRFACLDGFSGKCRWSITLSDRIESSCSLSICGRFIVVGCYDGRIYAINARTGQVWWTIRADDAVRSPARLDFHTGLHFYGSYDGKLYILSAVSKKAFVCTASGVFLGEYNQVQILGNVGIQHTGPLAAAPCLGELDISDRRSKSVCVTATLRGWVHCFNYCYNVDTMGHTFETKQQWSYRASTPVFATPTIVTLRAHSAVFITEVGGTITSLKLSSGEKLWEIELKENVFASLLECYLPTCAETAMVACTQNGTVVCIIAETGAVFWRHVVQEGMTANAVHVPNTDLLITISTQGSVHVHSFDGQYQQLVGTIGSQVFGAPVIIDSKLFLGTRSDVVARYDVNF